MKSSGQIYAIWWYKSPGEGGLSLFLRSACNSSLHWFSLGSDNGWSLFQCLAFGNGGVGKILLWLGEGGFFVWINVTINQKRYLVQKKRSFYQICGEKVRTKNDKKVFTFKELQLSTVWRRIWISYFGTACIVCQSISKRVRGIAVFCGKVFGVFTF